MQMLIIKERHLWIHSHNTDLHKRIISKAPLNKDGMGFQQPDDS